MPTDPVSGAAAKVFLDWISQHIRPAPLAFAFLTVGLVPLLIYRHTLSGAFEWATFGASIIAFSSVLSWAWRKNEDRVVNRGKGIMASQRLRKLHRRIDAATMSEKQVIALAHSFRSPHVRLQLDIGTRQLIYDGILEPLSDPNREGFSDLRFIEEAWAYIRTLDSTFFNPSAPP